MTRDEIANRVKYTLGLQDDTTFSESDYVNDLIYEAIVDISARTRINARVINLETTAETQTHDLSTQAIIALLGIRDDLGDLDRYTIEDIEAIQSRGGRGYAYREPMLWISPTTTEPAILRVFGVFRPQKMTTGTQTPSDPLYGGLAAEFHPTILTYCLWKAGEYVQHDASGSGEKWRLQYEGQDGMSGEISKIKRIISKRVTPGAPRRRNPFRTVGVVPNTGYYTGG
jgi:hypothetical protein